MSLFGKNAQTRLDDIVATVVARVPPQEQAAVGAFIRAKMAALSGGTRAGIQTYSDSLSMSSIKGTANEADRERRRALMVLEPLKANGRTAQAIRALTTGDVILDLNEMIGRVRLAADGGNGHGLRLHAVFRTDLQGAPEAWLGQNRLLLGNIANDDAAYFNYKIGTDTYIVNRTPPGDAPAAYRFDAVSVPAVLWYNVPGRTKQAAAGSFAGIAGTELTGGATAMVSTQFSGCAFCFKVVAGRIFAAHIMPNDNDPDDASGAVAGGSVGLARQLAGLAAPIVGGNFAAPCPAGGTFYVYGRGFSNMPGHPGGYPMNAGPINAYMNVFGNYRHGAWRIYSQYVVDRVFTVTRLL